MRGRITSRLSLAAGCGGAAMPESSSSIRAACSGPGLAEAPSRNFALKFCHAPVVGAELLLERGPLDEGGSRRRYPVQPLRQPAIEVERKGRMGKRGKIGLVERHGMLLQAVEVVTG